MRLFILIIPGCPVWKSLKLLFCNFFGITTLSLHWRTLSHSEITSGVFPFFAVIFCLILVIKSSFIASLFISSSVTGSSLMVLAIMFLISQSVRKAAIIVSSKGSLYFGANLDPIYPTPPLGQDMTQGQFFKRSLAGLYSEFSFS